MATATTNMGLKSWNLGADPFVRQDLVDNWNIIDAHDHTGGVKGVQVPAGGIKDGAVTAAKVQAGALDGTKIAFASISDAALASPNNSAYRQVAHGSGVWDGTSGTQVFGMDTFYLSSASTMPRLMIFGILNNDYVVSGLNTRFRVRYFWGQNGSAGTGSVTFGIYPLTGTSGLSGLLAATFGAVVPSSTATVSAPAANSSGSLATADFAMTDGVYVFGLSSSGMTPVGTMNMSINWRLQVHNV